MWWQYLLVFIGAFLFDVVPFPFLPAFTIMVFFQIMYGLNIWTVIVIGVAGSILGRYVLTLYIPFLSGRIFKPSKNDDVRFLGGKMKENVWEGRVAGCRLLLITLADHTIVSGSGYVRNKCCVYNPRFFYWKIYKRCGDRAYWQVRSSTCK